MIHLRVVSGLALSLIVGGMGLRAETEETVNIPRARLQELERKEAELESLKSEFKKSQGENVRLKKQEQENIGKLARLPAEVPMHVSPPMNSLPALTEGETVDALDLANHYRADSAAADARYRKRTFTVKGEIAEFEIRPFISSYKVLLKTGQPQMRVSCEISRPEKYTAVFTTERGAQLVGLLGGQTRVPLARVGDPVVIEGRCTGGDKAVVTLSRCALK
jgi:hypothetical protein